MSNMRSQYVTTSELFNQRVPLQVLTARLYSLENWPSLDAQTYVTDMFGKYADFLPFEYCKSVIKCIAKDLDTRGAEVSDELMALIIKYSSPSTEDDDKAGWIIYTGDTQYIQGKAMVYTANRHNQVGMKVWAAGLYLAELLLAVPQLIAQRQVVELGAGTGCTSLIAALCPSPPARIIATDFHDDVLLNLQRNIDMTTKCNTTICNVDCQALDWMKCYRGEVSSLDLRASLGITARPVVLAADCCYSEDLCDLLLHVISLLLQPPEGSNDWCSSGGPAVALVASTVRNPDTYAFFEGRLAVMEGWFCKDITEWARRRTEGGGSASGGNFQPMFYFDGRDAIRLVCISKSLEDAQEFLRTENIDVESLLDS